MKFLAKIKKLLFQIVLIGLISLLLFEVLYRNGVIDFYKSELKALNTEETLSKKTVDFLVFGDSFSATAKEINYIDKLRNAYPDKSFVNASIPGIGIRQVNTFAGHRIKQYEPKAIIYQIYVGNDLIDVDHLWSTEKFSLTRNLYWEASDYFLGLSYLNHKASVFRSRVNSRSYTMATDEFSVAYYDQRTKRFLNFDRSYLTKILQLKTPFLERYNEWLNQMHVFLKSVPEEVPVYLVWIPHCSQVSEYYQNNLQHLGAVFNATSTIQQTAYPFFTEAKKDLKMYTNVTFLNPLSAFQQHDNSENRLYFANDPHTNDYGNIVLSNFLQSAISFE